MPLEPLTPLNTDHHLDSDPAGDVRLDRIAAVPSRSRAPGERALPDVGAGSRVVRGRRAARPDSWRHRAADRVSIVAARTGVTPRAVVGLLLLGAAVVGVLVVRLLLVDHGARPVPLRMAAATGSASPWPSIGAATASTSAPTGLATTSPRSAAAGPGIVLVHVVGQVRHPGVVRLPAGARVEQAIEAAGGATSKADLVRINLARPVVDGEQIVVPKPGEAITGAPGVVGEPLGPGSTAGAAPVDLNTADLTELDTLPGVGPVLAQRILDWRSKNGRFSTVDELGEVSGIGEKVLENLRPLVRV
jgi:competence protein ComEA